MRTKSGAALPRVPAEPWASFLRELDKLLKAAVELHCLGGFVVTLSPPKSSTCCTGRVARGFVHPDRSKSFQRLLSQSDQRSQLLPCRRGRCISFTDAVKPVRHFAHHSLAREHACQRSASVAPSRPGVVRPIFHSASF